MKKQTSLAIVIATAFLLVFETYTIAVIHLENGGGLPENVGNSERIRNSLKEQAPKEKFSFAVVGDTRTTGSFERLCDKLRDEPLSFMVILGDFVDTCTKSNHDYFRSECTNKYRLLFPVFLVVGNQDVLYGEMGYDLDKVSLTDFERMYGPVNFSFEYGGCLFIGLCILPPPLSTKHSLEFLDSTLATHRGENRKVFVFAHMPVVRSAGPVTSSFENVQGFMDVIDRYGVDYVITSHFHGYDRTKRKDTVYLVTGGGGAPLDEKETFGSLHHAVVLTVNHESVSEKIVSVPHCGDMRGDIRHFDMAELSSFLRRHPALTIVENLVILSVFCVFLRNVIRLARTLW